ncbi:MAG: PLD nuclease N-terminal domain-containing protein [Desulfomicrobium sp.]|jgi:hypothetical protein|nr:PLD nuclease N-terminal domain-containing protein [Pseudomonadota bacterium]MBV1711793.1 PLD nuclease N-terminal domain-containing protein [Desulfomicrobium sp.]MBU4572619.1 PLD nuclease N-terminal domain-containing protein [Pseudomonadota bacterium]MBU4593600.1 PLD nuclease N-terminal domain-containing protein [Pseudomonadota bacterium]MBV1719145.1 PLD nuclease N-terminal domain-containing protein [Desulfomicrobium sp.]
MLASIPAENLYYAIPLLILPILPNLWAIWHLHTREFATPQEKMAWIVAQIVLPVVGGVGYILFGRKRSLKKQ